MSESTLAYCQIVDRRYEADTSAESECPYCRALAAEADNAGLRGMLRDEIMRAKAAEAKLDEQFETNVKLLQENIELKAERDAFAGENEAIHRAVNELCGTDTSTIEAVQHVITERDEARRQLEQAQREIAKLEAELKNAGEAYAEKAYTVAELQRIVSEVIAERDEARHG